MFYLEFTISILYFFIYSIPAACRKGKQELKSCYLSSLVAFKGRCSSEGWDLEGYAGGRWMVGLLHLRGLSQPL